MRVEKHNVEKPDEEPLPRLRSIYQRSVSWLCNQYVLCFLRQTMERTHRSRPGERDFALVYGPVVAGLLPVGEGPIEGCPDVLHTVHTHRIALKDITSSKKEQGTETERKGERVV